MTDNEDICGLCGLPGADKIPHPIRWPGERRTETDLVHTECEKEECSRSHTEFWNRVGEKGVREFLKKYMKYLIHCYGYEESEYYGFESDIAESILADQLANIFESTDNKTNFNFYGMYFTKYGKLYNYRLMTLDKFWEESLQKKMC
jgi:hypothetical protein